MGQPAEPLSQERIDFARRQGIANGLQSLGIDTSLDAIVQSLVCDLLALQLALGVFMAVQAELGVIGK
jgi:hypothetical protein